MARPFRKKKSDCAPKAVSCSKYSSGLQRGEVNVSAADEWDTEMNVFLPTACYALCQPLENADAPSVHHSFPPPPTFFITEKGSKENLKTDCKEEAAAASWWRRPSPGRAAEMSVEQISYLKSWDWRQDVSRP